MNNREYQMKPLKKYYNKLSNLYINNDKNKIPIIDINLGNEIAVCIDYGLEILPNNLIKNFIGYDNIKDIPRNDPQLIEYIRNNHIQYKYNNREIYNVVINEIYHLWNNKIEIITVNKDILPYLYFNIYKDDNDDIVEEIKMFNK